MKLVTTSPSLLLAVALLAGCQKPSPNAVAAAVAPASAGSAAAAAASAARSAPATPAVVLPPLDRSTPESTMKSYWAVQDAMLAVRPEPCAPCVALREHFQGTLTGEMRESMARPPSPATVLSREIKETKKGKPPAQSVEIVVLVRNVTPMAPGAEQDRNAMKQREKGERYKYALVQTPEGWKIDKVWSWFEWQSTWLEISSPKPRVPFQTLP